MLTEGKARRAFELLDESDLLVQVLPEISKMKGVQQPPQFHPEGDVWIHTLMVVDGTSDARADVYAAGVVLYELLTGSKPHEGESPIAVAYKHVHEDVPPPSRSVPGIPAYLDAFVARATARDRAQRPADAGVMLHQLHRVSQALSSGA